MKLSESQKGRSVELLIGAALMLQSDGVLRVSVPLVDDEGVDLVIGNRFNDKTILLQIKSRFTLTGRGQYTADVRRATCSPDPNRFLLFVYYDRVAVALGDTCWLVPAKEFCSLCSGQLETRAKYIFASKFTAQNDKWRPFRIPVKELAFHILKKVREKRLT